MRQSSKVSEIKVGRFSPYIDVFNLTVAAVVFYEDTNYYWSYITRNGVPRCVPLEGAIYVQSKYRLNGMFTYNFLKSVKL